MIPNELKQEVEHAADQAKANRDASLAAVADQYGEAYADFVRKVSDALILSKGIIQVGLSKDPNGDPMRGLLSKMMATDMLIKLVALVCDSAQEANGLTQEVGKEALEIAKEIADALTAAADPIINREAAKENKGLH